MCNRGAVQTRGFAPPGGCLIGAVNREERALSQGVEVVGRRGYLFDVTVGEMEFPLLHLTGI